MKETKAPEDLFSFVRDEGEMVIAEYSNTAKRLRREGVRGFFLPAMSGGLFLILVGLLSQKLFPENMLTGALVFLGMLLSASAVIFYAIFERRARTAESARLYITTRRAVYISEGSYACFELCDVNGAYTKKGERLSRLPFDISQLEGEYLVLFCRGGETKLPYIEDAAGAAEKILGIIG